MNWTGGRLSRHSRGANISTASKQKQHFAMVRSQLMGSSAKRGPTKYGFDGVASQSRNGIHYPCVKPDLCRENNPLRLDVRVYSSHKEEANSEAAYGETQNYEKPNHIDMINVDQKPFDFHKTRQKPTTITESIDINDEAEDKMEVIRRKRLKILRDGDWLGLSIQRPLRLKYSQSESQDVIGKRRKLHVGNEAQYVRLGDKIVSPFKPMRHIQRRGRSTELDQNDRQFSQSRQPSSIIGDVRICIDGRERNIVTRSGTASFKPQTAYTQSSTSDIMLLDLDGGKLGPEPQKQLNSGTVNVNECIPTLQMPEHNGHSSETKSESSLGAYPSSGPLTHRTHKRNRNTYSSMQLQQGLRRSYTASSPSHAMGHNICMVDAFPRNPTTQRTCSNTISEIQDHAEFNQCSDHIIGCKQEPAFQFEFQHPAGVLATPRKASNLISPTSIHHPRPQGSMTSRLLQSDSSEFGNSIAATAGRNATVTASVTRDEGIWRSLLTAGCANEQSPTSSGSFQSSELGINRPKTRMSIARNISSALSSINQPDWIRESGEERRLMVSISNNKSLIICPLVGESFETHDKGPNSETSRSPYSSGITVDGIQLPMKVKNEQRLKDSHDTAWETFILGESCQSLADSKGFQKPVIHEDPDAAWKKFVLSSDSGDENMGSSTVKKKAELESSSSQDQRKRSLSEASLKVHSAETAFHSELLSEHTSNTTSDEAIDNIWMHPLPPDSSSIGEIFASAVTETTYSKDSAVEAAPTPNHLPQAFAKFSKGFACDQLQREGSLSCNLPVLPRPKHKAIQPKQPQSSHPGKSYENGLGESLGEELYIAKNHLKQDGQAHKRTDRKNRKDVYDVPSSDDTEEEEG